jgi:hypothetical protein
VAPALLIVTVVAVVIVNAHAPPPTPAELAATAEARLLTQPYAPNGIGPCVTSTASAPVGAWQWSPGLVTCPSDGVTRLEDGGYIAFDGFGQAGFPQSVTVSVEVSFLPASPTSSPNTPAPGATPTPPGASAQAYAMPAALSPASSTSTEALASGGGSPCLSIALNGEPAHEQNIIGVILCNNGTWINAAPPGSPDRIGGVIQTPSGASASYTVTFKITRSSIEASVSDQPIELAPSGPITTHPPIADLTFSTIGSNVGVDIRNVVLARQA